MALSLSHITCTGTFEGLHGAGELCEASLRLAVGDCVRSHQRGQAPAQLTDVQERLWREPAGAVSAAYHAAQVNPMLGRMEDSIGGRHGLLAHRTREARRPLPTRDRRGLPVSAMAAHAGMDRETLARLLEHHGYLELVPYGGRQRRRLVTQAAYDAELGHNADGSGNHVAHLEGAERASVFPVFYPDAVAAILWTLDLDGITSAAAALPTKRKRLAWLLVEHGYLPDAEVARLAGVSERSVRKARGRLKSQS